MIDSTKSPVPTWRRYGTIVLLGVVILVAAFLIYTKEIKKSSSTASPPSNPAAVTVTHSPSGSSRKTATNTATTIPGGIAISNRNPFGS